MQYRLLGVTKVIPIMGFFVRGTKHHNKQIKIISSTALEFTPLNIQTFQGPDQTNKKKQNGWTDITDKFTTLRFYCFISDGKILIRCETLFNFGNKVSGLISPQPYNPGMYTWNL